MRSRGSSWIGPRRVRGRPAPSRKALILDRAGADARSSPRSGPKRPTQAVKATSPPSSPRRPCSYAARKASSPSIAVAVARARSRSSRWNAGTGASASWRRRSAWPEQPGGALRFVGLGGEGREHRAAGRHAHQDVALRVDAVPEPARAPRHVELERLGAPRRSPRRCGRGAGGGRPSRSGRGTAPAGCLSRRAPSSARSYVASAPTRSPSWSSTHPRRARREPVKPRSPSASLVAIASSQGPDRGRVVPARSSKSATMPRHIESMTGRSIREKPSAAAR